MIFKGSMAKTWPWTSGPCRSFAERPLGFLVYDLGDGTLVVSLLTVDNGVFDVVATNGVSHLGDVGFDQRVVQHFINIFKEAWLRHGLGQAVRAEA